MKKEFLKMAGVKSEKDFYNLFPTEQHFFELYPQAKSMLKMRYGGGLPMYQTEGDVPPSDDAPEIYNPTNFAAGPPTTRTNMFKGSIGYESPKNRTIDANFNYNPANKNRGYGINASLPTKYGNFSFGVNRQNTAVEPSSNEQSGFMMAKPTPSRQRNTNVNFGYEKQGKLGKVKVSAAYENQRMQMGGEPQMQEQQMQQQGQAQGQEEQIINFVAQSLMERKSVEEIMQTLVQELGMEEQQAMQLIQAVGQEIQKQMGAEQQGAQQEAPAEQPMMRYGGYSGTYDAGSGSYFKMGGNSSSPNFEEGSIHDLPQAEIDNLIKKGYKIKYI